MSTLLKPSPFPPSSRYRTVPCRHYAAGNCRFGSRCSFIHHHSQLEFTNPSPHLETGYSNHMPHKLGSVHPLSSPAIESQSDFKKPKNYDLGTSEAPSYLPAIESIGNGAVRLFSNKDSVGETIKLERCQYFDAWGSCPMKNNCEYLHEERVPSSAQKSPSLHMPNTNSCYRTKDCKFYFEGVCFQGDRCAFRHEKQKQIFSPEPEHPYYRTRPCAYFQMGTCNKGELCTYIHSNSQAPLVLARRPLKVCRFYTGPGSCRFGDDCNWRHLNCNSNTSYSVFSSGEEDSNEGLATSLELVLGEDIDDLANPTATPPSGLSLDLRANPVDVGLESSSKSYAPRSDGSDIYEDDAEDEVVYTGEMSQAYY